MSFPVPLEETEITGHVRRFDRRHVIPSGGELSVPFATNFNDHQVAPGLPSKNTIHRQHYNVYGEHKEAFANPVGAARRSSVAASSGDGNHRYSNMGGFARKQRDLERLRERTLAKQKRDPKTNAMHQAATQLATSNLNTKSLFQHFDRNQDGTINFNSFSNGLRLAGVKTPTSIQRELFDNSANNGQLDYKRFVDDMKIKSNLINNQRTSLEIEDPHEQHKERKEQNARDRKYGDGYGLNLRSNSILPGRIIGEGSNAFTSATKRRLAWNDMSKSDKQQHLVHDHVMRSLQEKSDKVEAAFVSVDKQRDGCLNNSEFQQGLKRVGITLSPEDASSFFSGLPRRSDGLLDYHQFAEFLQRSKVKHYSLGQVRATNYTKHNSRSHIVQQRVADAVAAKRKNLEIVFREKDQGRGGRDSIARRDGLVSIHDVDDVLKSCGVILSNQDTERLFDRVDLNSNGLVSYHDFLKSTCGEYAIDLPESTEDKKRRVRHLRSWNAISGAKDSGELPEDLVVKEAWQRGRRPSVVSVKNPANILQKKERDQLVTQQRIVNLYAKHAIELKEVFAVHQDEPIDENQFLRGTQLAGISIASSDAKRLFASLSSKDAATGRSYVDGKSFIKTLESYDLTGVEFHGDAGPNGKMKPMEKKKRIFDETESQHAQDRGLFGPPPPLPSHTNTGTLVGHQHHTHFVSDPASKKTNDWIMGDQIVRQERLASEKILRKITNATNPKIGTRPSLTLEKAFENVSNVRDGFVNMDEFQEGMSNLGVQLSRKDCRDLFSHFNATETDTLSIHSFTALVCDRQRTEHLDSSQGMRFLSERHDDHRILLDAWGVPSRVKMAQDDDSENGQYSGTRSGIQHGRIDNSTMSKDVQKRLRVIAPKDPESARQYLLYVFRKHDNSGRNGTISHSAFRNALSNFDSTFTGRRAAAVIDVLDTNHDGRINYFEFVDSVLNIDQRMYEQIPKTTGYEKDIKINAARLSKKSERLNWNKHRWQHFQNHWVEKHGRAAAKEIARDASIPPSGESWSSAPQHKQPFRVLHSIVRAPPSPMAAPTKR